MRYATWKLNFENENYGTGPEDLIREQGGWADGAFLIGEAKNGRILGYFDGPIDSLQNYDFLEITQYQALDLAKSLNAGAYLLADGRIATIESESGE